MENELISIVVPIYNVENYLRMCLDSIQKQTYTNFECLLINDGTPDNSAEICREYVAKDSRFRYFEKENGGLSSARNYGIERAEGSFITFVDSDDWLEGNSLEILSDKMNQYDADVVVSCYCIYDEEKETFLFFTYGETYDKIYSTKELLEMLPVLEGQTLSFLTSWGILFKKKLFEHISFPVGKINEDIATNYKCYMQAKKIVYAHKNTYCYRLRNTSISHASFTEKMMRDDHDARIERIALLALKGYDISNYLTQHKQYLKAWHAHAIENGFLNSRETHRLEELDFLLSMNGVKCDE